MPRSLLFICIQAYDDNVSVTRMKAVSTTDLWNTTSAERLPFLVRLTGELDLTGDCDLNKTNALLAERCEDRGNTLIRSDINFIICVNFKFRKQVVFVLSAARNRIDIDKTISMLRYSR